LFSETKKEGFPSLQLQQLDPRERFSWNWLRAVKTAGGILVVINYDIFDIVRWDIFSYRVSVQIEAKKDSVIWRVIDVYDCAYEEHKLDFINELHNVVACWSGPTLVGGDFNLIRDRGEKNIGNINQHWANLFNDWINKFNLLELKNPSRQFSWDNNQDNLVMALLDRVFVSTCWEALFPASSLASKPRVGSDHAPLIVDTGALKITQSK
jgi:hypothetical protein